MQSGPIVLYRYTQLGSWLSHGRQHIPLIYCTALGWTAAADQTKKSCIDTIPHSSQIQNQRKRLQEQRYNQSTVSATVSSAKDHT
jgi:hypothetical protein